MVGSRVGDRHDLRCVGLDDIYWRGLDQGGGVAGINYAEKSDGTRLNYKFYNLRGDVVLTRDTSGSIKTRSK